MTTFLPPAVVISNGSDEVVLAGMGVSAATGDCFCFYNDSLKSAIAFMAEFLLRASTAFLKCCADSEIALIASEVS